MSSPPERELRAGTSGDYAGGGPGSAAPSGMTWLRKFFNLEGFGAGLAYTKGQIRLFVGNLTGQVRFAPLRGRFPTEIWT